MHHSDVSLTTKVYRKTTHTDTYLSFDSHHPLQHQSVVAKTLFNRAGKICSTNEAEVKENLHVKTALKKNGCPIHFIKKIAKQARVTRNTKPRMILQKWQCNTVCEKPVRKYSENFTSPWHQNGFQTIPDTKKYIDSSAGQTSTNKKREVVYQITCKTCTMVYIGQTGRMLEHRLKNINEHWNC